VRFGRLHWVEAVEAAMRTRGRGKISPYDLPLEDALTIDSVNEALGPGARGRGAERGGGAIVRAGVGLPASVNR